MSSDSSKPSSRDAASESGAQRKLRSRAWFDNPANIDMTALYLERYLNYGLTREELQSGKPIIGIAQTGSDLSPCNRHHLFLAERVIVMTPRPGTIVLDRRIDLKRPRDVTTPEFNDLKREILTMISPSLHADESVV